MVHVCMSLCCPLLCVDQMIAVSQPHVVRCFIRNQSGLSRLFAHYTVRRAALAEVHLAVIAPAEATVDAGGTVGARHALSVPLNRALSVIMNSPSSMPIRLYNQNMDEDEHMSLPQLLALGKVWPRR